MFLTLTLLSTFSHATTLYDVRARPSLPAVHVVHHRSHRHARPSRIIAPKTHEPREPRPAKHVDPKPEREPKAPVARVAKSHLVKPTKHLVPMRPTTRLKPRHHAGAVSVRALEPKHGDSRASRITSHDHGNSIATRISQPKHTNSAHSPQPTRADTANSPQPTRTNSAHAPQPNRTNSAHTPAPKVTHHHRPKKLIVGGLPVTASDPIQRSTAALYSPSATGPGGALCTASLISPNTAVTAAHCLQGDSYSPVMIFGNDIRSPDAAKRPVIGKVVNPNYGKTRGMDQGDIAVVKFGGGLPKGYKPATLDTDDDVKKGERAILAGYGISNAQTKQGAGILRKADVTVANARTGKSEMIFDQSHGRGACHGDSGGPAFFEDGRKIVLGGVTNRSYPNTAADDCAHKVVYTKISSYRPWIEKSEAELNRAPTQLKAKIKLKHAKKLARN